MDFIAYGTPDQEFSGREFVRQIDESPIRVNMA